MQKNTGSYLKNQLRVNQSQRVYLQIILKTISKQLTIQVTLFQSDDEIVYFN